MSPYLLVETIRPAEVPASDLPEVEPTPADLLAIEVQADDIVDDRLLSGLHAAAREHTHRELMQIRAQLNSIDRAARDEVRRAA